jgi:hypothetical protein
MKAIILATCFFLAYGLVITVLFRVAKPASRALWMLRLYLIFLVLLLSVHTGTPPDLGFLPTALVERYPVVDLVYAAFVFSASFFGGWLQLYNLADRGLSLRILIDAGEDSAGRIDENSIIQRYSNGNGIAWMYQKRLDDLVRLALIRVDDSRATITKKGIRYAKLSVWSRKFLGISQKSEDQPVCRPG